MTEKLFSKVSFYLNWEQLRLDRTLFKQNFTFKPTVVNENKGNNADLARMKYYHEADQYSINPRC